MRIYENVSTAQQRPNLIGIVSIGVEKLEKNMSQTESSPGINNEWSLILSWIFSKELLILK